MYVQVYLFQTGMSPVVLTHVIHSFGHSALLMCELYVLDVRTLLGVLCTSALNVSVVKLQCKW